MFRFQRTLLAILIASSSSSVLAQSGPPTDAHTPETEPPPEAPPVETPPPEAAPVVEVTSSSSAAAAAGMGTVTGTIIDNATQTGLPAATISIQGPGGPQTLVTELDGTFTLSLAPGEYTIEFQTPEYVPVTKKVTVVADQAQTLSLGLDVVPAAKASEETIEVYDTIDTRKTSALLAERRFAATVSDAVSAEQISRSPDSNAGDAAKRMVAATIQDNRYIVMRGLGGRYSLTLLNGVPLPSPDPDMPAAPLDLFPASLVSNLTVTKTFSPDSPGNFAGGSLGIETRTYPTKFTFKARAGMANNTLSSWQTVNGQSGGSLDLLGFDDGSRSMPSSIPDGQLAGDPSLTQEQANAQAAGFRNNWEIERGTAGPNIGLGAQVGDTFKVGTQRIGYFASASYGHGYQERRSKLARVGESDGNGGFLPSLMQLDDVSGIQQASLSSVAGVGWTPKTGHRVDLFGLYSHSADITASQVTGTENNASVVDRTRLQFLERQLAFTQLLGEHKLPNKLLLEWQASVSRVSQNEPDTRDLLRTQTPDGRYAIANGSGTAERMFGDLTDNALGTGASLTVPVAEQAKIKFGGALHYSDRAYQQRRFHFNVNGEAAYANPNEAFDPRGAGTAMSLLEVTLPSDGYAADRLVAAAYALGDISLTKKLRLIGGARFEAARLDVGIESKIDMMTPPVPRTERNDNNVLPALNAVYEVMPGSNLRAAYGMTVGRPNFREIAPTLYFDYVRRRTLGGNPMLEQTTIHNGDLRWETFLGDNEVLAASVFYKYFNRPIERVVEQAGDGQNVSFVNSENANTYGVELEARLSFGRVAKALDEFSLGANLSLIRSEIQLADSITRALQGQSPYVANLGLGYESKATRTRVDVLYNSFGRRIEEVGTGGAGNIYEEPVHRLDLAVSQPLRNDIRLKLTGANLLDQRVVRTQNDVEILAYKLGVTVVGSVEMSIE